MTTTSASPSCRRGTSAGECGIGTFILVDVFASPEHTLSLGRLPRQPGVNKRRAEWFVEKAARSCRPYRPVDEWNGDAVPTSGKRSPNWPESPSELPRSPGFQHTTGGFNGWITQYGCADTPQHGELLARQLPLSAALQAGTDTAAQPPHSTSSAASSAAAGANAPTASNGAGSELIVPPPMLSDWQPGTVSGFPPPENHPGDLFSGPDPTAVWSQPPTLMDDMFKDWPFQLNQDETMDFMGIQQAGQSAS
jgi:hypothetical protein